MFFVFLHIYLTALVTLQAEQVVHLNLFYIKIQIRFKKNKTKRDSDNQKYSDS